MPESILKTTPEVGPRPAEAVVSYMDDAARLTRNKRVGSYFGFAPRQDGSAKALEHTTGTRKRGEPKVKKTPKR